MKNYMRPSLLILSLLVLCNSCSEILFDELMPRHGEKRKQFPAALYGSWALKDSTKLEGTSLEFLLNRAGQTEMYVFTRIHEDSLNSYIHRAYQDYEYAYKITDSLLSIRYDTITTRITVEKHAPYLHLNRQLSITFDFDRQEYIDVEDRESFAMHLRQGGKRYYLNMANKDNKWDLIGFYIEGEALHLKGSMMLSEDVIENISYLSAYTRVVDIEAQRKFKNIKASINPDDEALEQIFEDEHIMEPMLLTRIREEHEGGYPVWAYSGIALVLLMALALLLYKLR